MEHTLPYELLGSAGLELICCVGVLLLSRVKQLDCLLASHHTLPAQFRAVSGSAQPAAAAAGQRHSSHTCSGWFLNCPSADRLSHTRTAALHAASRQQL